MPMERWAHTAAKLCGTQWRCRLNLSFSVLSVVCFEAMTRLRNMAEHLNDLSELLEQQVSR